MKRILYKAVCFLVTFVLMAGVFPPIKIGVEARTDRPASASHQMRGVWVTSAYNLDWPSRHGLTAAQIRTEIDDILTRSAALGLTAVFVQVRPAADSLFPSEIFPWSAAFTGVAGQVPAFYANGGFDPLAYWIERGHALGIEVHAWLNPFRVTHRSQRITDPRDLPVNHPVRINPGLSIAHDNALFLDPGNPAARQLIADGVAEILRNYPTIDGIHLDDYFYPSRNFPDDATFQRYGGDFDDIHDWRRDNINQLIQLLQSTVREINPRVRWGVSPTAIWMNAENDPRGSQTRGSESFHNAYADTRRWVLEGWVDYIVPQIYWTIGFDAACYDRVLTWWEGVAEGTGVDLYVGIAPYREITRNTDSRFTHWTEGEILRQLERNSRSNIVTGAIFFRAAHLNGTLGNHIGNFYSSTLSGNFPDRVPTPPHDAPSRTMTRLSVAQPLSNRTVVNASNWNFFGTAVPGLPLHVNGIEVTNRTEEGFFSIFLPLVRGANTFTFTQPGQADVVRVITNNAPTVTPAATMDTPAVTNVFPATDEWAQRGMAVTLRATAPGGATVTATIGNQTIQMTQTNESLISTANRIYAASFTGQFTLNTPAEANAITDLGRVTYTATFRNQTFTATSAARIRQLGPDAPFFAEVTDEGIWGFPNASDSGGSHWMYVQGQTDRVTAITGNWTRLASGIWVPASGGWTRLASGMWVLSSGVRTFQASAETLNEWFPPLSLPGRGILSEGRYIIGEAEDRIIWNAPLFPGVFADFDGSELIVTLGMQHYAPPIFLPIGETFFEGIRIGEHHGAPAYFMTLREDAILEGFYVEFDEYSGELHLVLRKRRPLTPGNFPLAGFTFVLDAGHGGNDSGAIGPMGAEHAEKHIVMDVTNLLAERLEMLGAEIILTRSGDYRVELADRPMVSFHAMPDMFISIHSDSTAETTNAANIHGLTVWYRNPNSLPAARAFQRSLRYLNPLTNRANQVNQQNFRVCRPVWTPSILMELSFTNNINDFAWLIDPRRQVDMAWGIVNAVLGYYR
ncbi:MAG: family 10 glycosylhydrolase [Defluviitaleaceae bacterium]|nr:family 10 glycosylhydrolase [Defluviitaleaceae bacterium]